MYVDSQDLEDRDSIVEPGIIGVRLLPKSHGGEGMSCCCLSEPSLKG